MKKPRKYFLTRHRQAGGHAFAVRETDSTPFLYHLASLVELHEAQKAGALYTHHFNKLRRVMEQTACFLGYPWTVRFAGHGRRNRRACLPRRKLASVEIREVFDFIGAPDTIRTCDLCLRRGNDNRVIKITQCYVYKREQTKWSQRIGGYGLSFP
jgi:hypothetical protein